MLFRALLIALSLTFGALPAPAQDGGAPAISADAVRAHIEFLAEDALEGRKAGTRGYDFAANYVAAQFNRFGLEPIMPGGEWFQPVTLAEMRLDPKRPASIEINGKRFPNIAEVLVNATPRGGGGTQVLSAPAVFVGHGLDAPDLGFDDYAGLDLKGKYAVMLAGLPAGLPADRSGALADERSRMACDRGAIGVLYVMTPDYLATNRWESMAGYFMQPQTIWLTPEGTRGGIDPRVESGGFIGQKAAAELFRGAPMNAVQLFAAASTGKPVPGFDLPAKVTVTRTSIVREFASSNVVAVLPGSDPKLAGEYLLLSAHLDHVGTDRRLRGDRIFNGALDNAAGVATMLETARAFTMSGKRPRRPILFVALTGEEMGLLGSDYLAHYPVTGAGNVVADVNLDMPMLLYDFRDVVAFGAERSTLGAMVAAAAAKMGITVSPDPMPREDFFTRSDHFSFVKAGVPSVSLTTGFANGGDKAFRTFLETRYHKPSDQSDQGIDWQAGARFAKLNYLIARQIADADEAPRWYSDDPYGRRYAPQAPKAARAQP